MKFELYDVKTSKKIKDHIAYVNFGDIPQGEHCAKVVVLRVVKTTEATVTSLELFLQSKGSYSDSNFGFFKGTTIDETVLPGDNNMNAHFVLNGSPVAGGTGSKAVDENDYIYLDADLALDRYAGQSLINFRLLFDYT